VAIPSTGAQKVFEEHDEHKLRVFYEKRMGAEVEADSLGDDWKGYVLRITGGNDKQGFPMKQGVLTNGNLWKSAWLFLISSVHQQSQLQIKDYSIPNLAFMAVKLILICFAIPALQFNYGVPAPCDTNKSIFSTFDIILFSLDADTHPLICTVYFL